MYIGKIWRLALVPFPRRRVRPLVAASAHRPQQVPELNVEIGGCCGQARHGRPVRNGSLDGSTWLTALLTSHPAPTLRRLYTHNTKQPDSSVSSDIQSCSWTQPVPARYLGAAFRRQDI